MSDPPGREPGVFEALLGLLGHEETVVMYAAMAVPPSAPAPLARRQPCPSALQNRSDIALVRGEEGRDLFLAAYEEVTDYLKRVYQGTRE
jgi:hypothetical protein